MTESELMEIEARLKAIAPADYAVNLDWTPEGTNEDAAIWYDDGDQCAVVYGNLALGIDTNSMARFFAYARTDVPVLIAEIRRLQNGR